MRATYIISLALDLDLVVVGLEERSAAGATVAGRTLTVTTSEVTGACTISITHTYITGFLNIPEGGLDVERVGRDETDVGRRAGTGRGGVHERHLEDSAVLAVEPTVAYATLSATP